MRKLIIYLLLSLPLSHAFCSTYFVAPIGNDNYPGTIIKPFATIQKAQSAVKPGDTVFLRGGIYKMNIDQVARHERIFAYVTYLDKSGTADAPINYFAYKNEKPVFDLAAIKPDNERIIVFYVSGSYLHFKGFEVTGVQVTIKTHTQSECFENHGSNNVYELLNMHDSMAIGFYLLNGSNNLVLNCDAYNNYDSVSEGGRGGNTDGFGCHPSKGSINNVFRGCRAWFNSDDGYDVIGAHEAVMFDHCWAFYNGFGTDFKSLGDGNGFKGGGYGKRAVESLPIPIPRHTIQFCLAVRNKANGFYSNHHINGSNWFNNSAYRNSTNYNMLNRLSDNVTDVAGYNHKMYNNLGYKGGKEVQNLDKGKCDLANNYFDLNLEVADDDFISLNEALLTAPRQADGALPDTGFMKIKPSSKLKGKGKDIGFKYKGQAPNIGCFE
jgi:hypothetical protein